MKPEQCCDVAGHGAMCILPKDHVDAEGFPDFHSDGAAGWGDETCPTCRRFNGRMTPGTPYCCTGERDARIAGVKRLGWCLIAASARALLDAANPGYCAACGHSHAWHLHAERGQCFHPTAEARCECATWTTEGDRQ